MSQEKPVKLAILWHMHQPNYQLSNSPKMIMPWVRLHALKDYLDMPLMASQYENVKVTFNLVPSLIDQIELYLNGGTDPHWELSRINAEQLNREQKMEILDTFFAGHPQTMIEPYPHFYALYKKARNNHHHDILPSLFSSDEMRDIQVWSNLIWVDPMFREKQPVKSLLAKEKYFTEEDKHAFLDWQLNFLKIIIPTYKKLLENNRIDISFTPYYHPILPLLCDTNVALEAMPNMELPTKSFVHPEDALWHIKKSIEKYQDIFGVPMKGMWPSEGSVSEEVARLLIEQGVKWIATDEEILYQSLRKSSNGFADNPLHTVYEYGPGLKLFFRDHALSDRIGFVYSGFEAHRAVEDFIENILTIRKTLIPFIDDAVISVILDGENAWEYFPHDGNDFLSALYQSLSEEPLIETVAMSDVAEQVEPRRLKSLFAGSWINHNFRIWIGHHEDNKAWDLLSKTRDELAQFEQNNPQFDQQKIEEAWKQIYIAEGSDWCWWYGDEHRGGYNEEFDKIYRQHLMAVYEITDREIPYELFTPIYSDEATIKAVMPDGLLTPTIDGHLTHFYEWSGSGYFDCLKSGGVIHRVDRYITKVYFSYDHKYFYIRLDFDDKKSVELIEKLKCQFKFFTPEGKIVEFELSDKRDKSDTENDYFFRLDSILEVAIDRNFLFEKGFGSLGVLISLWENGEMVESCPENESLKIDIPEINKEMFWPS